MLTFDTQIKEYEQLTNEYKHELMNYIYIIVSVYYF